MSARSNSTKLSLSQITKMMSERLMALRQSNDRTDAVKFMTEFDRLPFETRFRINADTALSNANEFIRDIYDIVFIIDSNKVRMSDIQSQLAFLSDKLHMSSAEGKLFLVALMCLYNKSRCNDTYAEDCPKNLERVHQCTRGDRCPHLHGDKSYCLSTVVDGKCARRFVDEDDYFSTLCSRRHVGCLVCHLIQRHAGNESPIMGCSERSPSEEGFVNDYKIKSYTYSEFESAYRAWKEHNSNAIDDVCHTRYCMWCDERAYVLYSRKYQPFVGDNSPYSEDGSVIPEFFIKNDLLIDLSAVIVDDTIPRVYLEKYRELANNPIFPGKCTPDDLPRIFVRKITKTGFKYRCHRTDTLTRVLDECHDRPFNHYTQVMRNDNAKRKVGYYSKPSYDFEGRMLFPTFHETKLETFQHLIKYISSTSGYRAYRNRISHIETVDGRNRVVLDDPLPRHCLGRGNNIEPASGVWDKEAMARQKAEKAAKAEAERQELQRKFEADRQEREAQYNAFIADLERRRMEAEGRCQLNMEADFPSLTKCDVIERPVWPIEQKPKEEPPKQKKTPLLQTSRMKRPNQKERRRLLRQNQ
jgi:hypothetical protein